MSSPSPFKSGSPDALSKRLKQCRSRRERQLIMESYKIEKREEIRMEKARLTALRLVNIKKNWKRKKPNCGPVAGSKNRRSKCLSDQRPQKRERNEPY